MTTVLTGQLEIDHDRGVIYFHNLDPHSGQTTVLRICSLPIPIPTSEQLLEEGGILDITHMYGTSWSKSEEDE